MHILLIGILINNALSQVLPNNMVVLFKNNIDGIKILYNAYEEEEGEDVEMLIIVSSSFLRFFRFFSIMFC